jgi:BirA family biotin operon repressor/biotin-[acetyl-CoA-carboxylase] ligase
MALANPTRWETAATAGRRIGHRVEPHRVIGSTNDRARALLATPDGEGVAVLTEEQVAGRGRLGRSWSSPPDRNLMVSVALRPSLPAADGAWLGIAAALAAWRACGTVAPVGLKWPNDVVDASGHKLGGLLVETAVDGDRLTEAVIGIGLNVNWRRAEMPPELERATSLAEVAGSEVDRAALLAALLAALDEEIAAVEAGHSPISRYRAACATLGTEVEVVVGERRVTGMARDVGDDGALVLDTAHGEVRCTSGEVVRVRLSPPS